MIALTDDVLSWVIGLVGDAGIQLIHTSRDKGRLRRILDAELVHVVSGVSPEIRATVERALTVAVTAPRQLQPGPGTPLNQALREVISSQLRVLGQWTDEDRGLGFPEVTGIRPDELVDRVADAVLHALRNYAAASGLTELVHGLDAAEVTTRLDALSLQIAGLTVNARAAATFTLPHDIASFTGRHDHLDRLLRHDAEVTRSGGHTISINAIDGMAGIGKTALAVHAAHLLADRYPDGRVFLHLHGHTPGQRPVEPADALATLLLTAGIPPAQIPADLQARAARWRDWVGAKRLLLVLDDAIASEQVRPLLPGSPEALVLITSRRRLTALNEVVSMSLDTLPADEAAELFTRLAARPDLAPSNPGVVEAVRLCGHLPLAIRLTAAQLAHHAAWTIDELVADLVFARDRIAAMRAENDSVASAFDLSYSDLTPNQQLMFRRLGLHVGTEFDAYQTAALTGFDLAMARRLLDDLYIHHLIDEPGRGRYRMHDLIKEQARALAVRDDADDIDASIGHLVDYFLHVAVSAAAHIAGRTPFPALSPLGDPPAWAPSLATPQDALGWLQTERTNLAAAVDTAQARTFPLAAINIPVVITQFLRGQGYWEQAVALTRIAEDMARKVNDPAGQALALLSRSSVQRIASEYPAAIDCLGRAIELHRSLGDRLGEATDLHELGVLQRLAYDYAGDEASQAAARNIYEELANTLGEANTHHEMGIKLWLTGDLRASLKSQSRARDLYRENRNDYGLAHAYGELALVNNSAGDYPTAAANVTNALRMHQDSGNRYAEAVSLAFLGTLQYLTGDYPAAIETLVRAVDLDRELGSRYAMGFALRELGVAWLRQGDLMQAQTVLIQAITTNRELGNRYGEGFALASLGRALVRQDSLADAEQNLTEALRIHREHGHRLGQTDALLGLAEIAARRGDFDAARDSYTEALSLARECGAALEEGQSLAGLAECEAATGDSGLTVSLWREALSILQRIGAPEAAAIERRLA
ncbi:MAG: ATP-binding protein [Trebonia sp.]